jgi:LPS-assembly lipoprotein
MNIILRITLPLMLAVTLSACGFQLRGSNLDTLKNSHVFVKSNGADQLTVQVIKQLVFSDVPVINDPARADYIIELSHESFKRTVLSVSASTGKVEEYEIDYHAALTVKGPGGKVLLHDDPVTAQRDFTFDPDAVLSKFDEEARLHDEMTQYAADSVLRKLQAITR